MLDVLQADRRLKLTDRLKHNRRQRPRQRLTGRQTQTDRGTDGQTETDVYIDSCVLSSFPSSSYVYPECFSSCLTCFDKCNGIDMDDNEDNGNDINMHGNQDNGYDIHDIRDLLLSL